MRAYSAIALLGACLVSAQSAQAASSVLVAASDPTQISEVEMAKVVAPESSVWLSVHVAARAKVAVVTSAAEPANAADSWLRALDFSTRVRVSPPLGPLAACTSSTGALADSGFPELASLLPSQVSSLASELELRRSLSAAGLDVDLARVAEFTAGASAPFRFALYEAAESGGSTAAVRFTDSGPALALPGVTVVGRELVPLTSLMLSPTAVLPAVGTVSAPSDFAIGYLGATASTDYPRARAAFLADDPTRWLLEARASSAFSAFTLIPGAGEIEPVLSQYFNATPGQRDPGPCFATVQAALARASRDTSDYACAVGDDLARTLSELDFGKVRLTRLFGSVGAAGVALRTSDEGEQGSHVVATDFDSKGCPAPVTVSPGASGSTVPSGTASPRGATDTSGTAVDDSSTEQASSVSDSGGCNVTVFSDSCSGDSSSSSSSSSDSCSGDSTSDSSSSDSCSGDSSSDSSSSDSCSGNGSSDSTSSDACSGDSSSSNSDDSSGCGKSNYDGDTCSGSSANSAAADGKSSAALAPVTSTMNGRRPRRVHLSLLTLALALIALPLRRKRLWRNAFSP